MPVELLLSKVGIAQSVEAEHRAPRAQEQRQARAVDRRVAEVERADQRRESRPERRYRSTCAAASRRSRAATAPSKVAE